MLMIIGGDLCLVCYQGFVAVGKELIDGQVCGCVGGGAIVGGGEGNPKRHLEGGERSFGELLKVSELRRRRCFL